MNKDLLCKNFVKRKEIFADAVNFILYDGENRILPSSLKELDPNQNLILEDFKIEKHRDVFNQVTLMEGDDEKYLLFGIENQSYIDYGMIVRCMTYDLLSYNNQIEELRKKNKNDKINNGRDYLSGIKKDQKLKPVITLVIYFGPDEWDGPRYFHDMLDMNDVVKPLIPNYKLKLISPYDLTNSELNKFNTELYNVLKYIKISKSLDKNNLYKMINEDNWVLETDTIKLINEITNSNLKISDVKGGKQNMCELLKVALEDAEKQGIEKATKDNIISLYENGVSLELLAKSFKMSEEEIKNIIANK
jgi:hypothetical protein